MKKHLFLCALGLLAGSTLHAGDYLQNGNFNEWTSVDGNPPAGEPTAWIGGKPVQAPGLAKGSKYSALLQGNMEIYQGLDFHRGFPLSFQIKQTVAITAGGDEWQQPLRITLQETGPEGKFDGRHNWIQLRITKDDHARSCSIEARSGDDSAWKPVAKNAIPLSEYDSDRNSYPRSVPVDIIITHKGDAKTYSVSYGESGRSMKTVDGLEFFAEPSNGSQKLAFVSYAAPGKESQYLAAVDDVSVSEK